MGKHIEHVQWIAVFVFRLLGSFTIDRTDDCRIAEDRIEKCGVGFLEVFVRKFPPHAGERVIAGCSRFAFDGAESEKRLQCFEVVLCPACAI